jgi:uncharacterized membrane protein (DUF106 family)
MKTRFLLFGLVFAAIVFLFKRLLDTQEKLVIAEAELTKLQREQSVYEQAFSEANQRHQDYAAEHPQPDDPDKKMRVAMLDAIFSADAREELGENYLDAEEDS